MSNGTQEAEQAANTATNIKTPADLFTSQLEWWQSARPGPVNLVWKGQGKSLVKDLLQKNPNCKTIKITETEDGKSVLECAETKSEPIDSKTTP
jgi:hypothetical protein